ncbi:MAG TPA: diacylglycerol kinase family protein [Verrucomicrobiae bacterium]|nr:diacylglycerol kinase family protein [Verrucomicrobiae bacterium]
MRTCVIFNPTAQGEKAKRLRRHLDDIGAEATLLQTRAVDHARQLAADAVRGGFEIVVAAGGDGTVNEVLNGIADADGFERTRLAVLPIGTVNVFAKELKLPGSVRGAWQVIRAAKETRIDLPLVEFKSDGATQRRFFAQLAGAGLDARAIELLSWSLKKKIGPLAYIVAGMQAVCGRLPVIKVSEGTNQAKGELVLIGNGSYYGGRFRIFPLADMRDGMLEVCVFPRANWFAVLCCGLPLLLRGRLPKHASHSIRTASVTLSSDEPVRFEVDGELSGNLPATFSIRRNVLRVIVP